ncbi:MAG: ferrochelatase, partial [Acidobacteria bacterium]|nr:ferrochelatase [Acidobacteriota bacterium]
SIPESMTGAVRYQAQLRETATEVAARLGISDWALVYQSRSGRPGDPWLEPDIGDYLRLARAEGIEAVVLCPIGFVCDHIEVLYDLDQAAADVAREIGLAMARADAVNDDPLFVDMMTDVVLTTIRRYATGRPLPLVAQPASPG